MVENPEPHLYFVVAQHKYIVYLLCSSFSFIAYANSLQSRALRLSQNLHCITISRISQTVVIPNPTPPPPPPPPPTHTHTRTHTHSHKDKTHFIDVTVTVD